MLFRVILRKTEGANDAMKNRILSALLIALSLAMLVGCGRRMQDNNGANAPDRTQQNGQNDTITDLPNAPDNGSNVQGVPNAAPDTRRPREGSVTQDAKNMLDDAGNMVGDAAKGVGDAVQDVGDAAKDATDGGKNTRQTAPNKTESKK